MTHYTLPDFGAMGSVLAAILFGSQARGDSDSLSDTDLFLLVRDMPFACVKRTDNEIRRHATAPRLNLCVHTVSIFEQMKERGSLFALHLSREGRIMYLAQGMADPFSGLSEFREHIKNIGLYFDLLNDCEESIRLHGPNVFDLSLMFTVCRNTCIVMCHKLGKPHFGRYDAYECIAREIPCPLPVSHSLYRVLSAHKLSYGRGTPPNEPLPDGAESRKILSKVQKLVKLGLEVCSHDR